MEESAVTKEVDQKFIEGINRIYTAARDGDDGDRCCVAPAPKLQKRINKSLKKLREKALPGFESKLAFRQLPRVGFNDGLLVPGDSLPLGTPPSVARNVGLARAPLRGVLNVAVVMIEFPDQSFDANHTPAHFKDLFFSVGTIAKGSVREYFDEVTDGLVTISGQVVGPYMMPNTVVHYANGDSGTSGAFPNAREMARDGAIAANPDVDFSVYDNDGDGFVDAYVVVHAGSGAEETGSPDDIWSHKWVLPSSMAADGVNIFAYLTIPEDARIGVCAHELGHLLFGFPDLYDTDSSSEGVGNWCLMGGGSWNDSGDTPAHPSAWCKANQGWVTVNSVTTNGSRSVPDIKTSKEVFRLWKDGASGQEYFLVENRQKTNFDKHLPGSGILIWHIDDAIDTNSNEAHPKVALEQADGLDDLGNGANRGDKGDPYPGSSGNTTFDNSSSPNSQSYAGSNTCVAVTNVSASGPTMTANIRVQCGKSLIKDTQDKSRDKTFWADKLRFEKRPDKWFEKPLLDKRPEKPDIDKRVGRDKGFDFDFRNRAAATEARSDAQSDLEARISTLEVALSSLQPFIDESMRPDLSMTSLRDEEDLQQLRSDMEQQQHNDKRAMDVPTYKR